MIEKIKYRVLVCFTGLACYLDRIIVPTCCVKESLPMVLFKKAVVIPNLFDSNAKRNASSSVSVFKSEGLRILNVGSEESRKNIDTLIKALALLEIDYHFVKIGNPVVWENRDANQKLAEELQVKVDFIDYVESDYLLSAYNECDVFVAPSVQEGFGRTLIEAQCHGKIIVASNIGVFKEVLKDTAILVDDYLNPIAWSSVLGELRGERQKVSEEKILLNAQRFSIDMNKSLVRDLVYGQ